MKNGILPNHIIGSYWTTYRAHSLDSSTISTLQKRKEEILCDSSFHFEHHSDSSDLGTSDISTFKNFHIQDRTSELTGKKFWSWKEFDYEEISVRGEGYTLDIYKFSEETAEYFKNPDKEFFDSLPTKEFADIRWTKTPVKEIEYEILEFVTPSYGGWKGEIVDRQDFIRDIANQPGAYYSFDIGGSTNFYLIAPDKRLVILINHNM
ncbi:hypothetical protein [[Muricauda] lutisoli]|uniref:Uncharacterized protein n=1 Tax=[Muricauda] lutisoli TaxID=2816035 RepID=A0ABS3EX33_9FLAO|nr:hypothetical protein [[Muricauda] lutisoli]MBO0330809.1 hypothetical protein [[Muricauda] lutisoli]